MEKKIEMMDIFMGLEKQLEEIEPAYMQAEKDYNFHLAEAEKAEALMNGLKINVDALRSAIDSLKKGNFVFPDFTKELEEKKEEVEPKLVLTIPSDEKPKTKPKRWMTQKGEVWKFAPDGTVLEKFTSQCAASRSMHWDQSGISKFMRFSHETQIRKKGFYLDWVG